MTPALPQEMTRQWDAEKALLERVHRLKEEIERVKIEAAAAVRALPHRTQILRCALPQPRDLIAQHGLPMHMQASCQPGDRA